MTTDSVGRHGFVGRHGLWSEAHSEAARRVLERIESERIHTVRLSFADQHGVLRGKALVADAIPQAMRSGCTITTTLLAKDTSHRTVFPVWSAGGGFGMSEMTGGGDVVMVPDPTTYRALPWAPGTGWMLCDLYFQDARPVPFSTRAICRDAMRDLAAAGYDYVSGLEIELHVFRLDDPKLEPEHATQPGTPPDFGLLAQGFQYLTENRLDELDPALSLLGQSLRELGLPLRSMEAEFGPSQIELTFHPERGMGTADNTVLLRAAVKQICRRNGLHATFMCRPQGPNLFSSGWHLHQSLVERDGGDNALMPRGDEPLSAVGRHFLGGLLEHARAACAFTTPTLNGYKRYRPHTLAPDRIAWGRDNRGAMLRVIGGAHDATTRIENRAGEPAANPYLYLASQVRCALAGIETEADPRPPTETPYDSPADALPATLADALDALDASKTLRRAFGDEFVDYLLTIKRAEIARFESEVTDWEQREYFGLF